MSEPDAATVRLSPVPGPGPSLIRHLRGLAAASRFLTSLPLPSWERSGLGDLRTALGYFPLVGLSLGGVLVVLDQLLTPVVARPLVDFALIACLVALSGALHLDGLIDTADGLFAAGPAEHRLAVMRESWAGPSGAAAGLTLLLLQYSALASLPASQRTQALLLAPLLGRWAVVYGYVAFPYARRTPGLTLALKQGATPTVGVAATLFTLLVGSLLSWPAGSLLLGLAWLLAWLVGRLALNRLGGMSGDVYGAVEQLVETVTLLLLPALTRLVTR